MKWVLLCSFLFFSLIKGDPMKLNKLGPEEKRVIINKGTETPYENQYYQHFEKGYYQCKQCDVVLYRSQDKFKSGCGWPAFDDEVPGAIKRVPDRDNRRTEILCRHCGGHLGHVFSGERMTDKNIRHCVNSISMSFIPEQESHLKKAVYAGGCFWGVEYYFQKEPGVVYTTVGYMGGTKDHPTYQDVCSGETGHIEVMMVEFDPLVTSFQKLTKLFFQIHDPTQINRQGPDIGEQYQSVIFYYDIEQKNIADQLISLLENKGFNIATQLISAQDFWPAENYHQDYYLKKGTVPYCHTFIQKFD